MTESVPPDHKASGHDDRERIDAIPPRAVVLGIDTEDRPHLFTTGREYEIWVLDETGTECVHHVGPTARPPSEWVAFVAQKCGWACRHRIELDAGEGLLDPEATPPTRAEVINA
jgi:hypothetical protein